LFFWHIAPPEAPQEYPDIDSGVISSLEELAENNEGIKDVLANADDYPESLLELLAANQETLSFVRHYPDRNENSDAGLTSEELTGWIPRFMQWDERWGYDTYGDDMIAITGCGPTCLSMVIVGLTGDLSADPASVAAFSSSKGYFIENSGTDWGLMTEGAGNYGLESMELSLWKDSIIQELNLGHPVICAMGPGEFTTTGHFIVICGYENDEFIINDPNSMARSDKRWAFDSFSSQVENLWSYSAA